jgi:putative SOS response-associated peptidase YedK
MRWGFKLPDRLLFNTRSEGVDRANFWKKMFAEHRCLIPASSFYEWEKLRNGCKPKYEITLPGRELFGLAGMWSRWRNPKTEQWEDTFSVLTRLRGMALALGASARSPAARAARAGDHPYAR